MLNLALLHFFVTRSMVVAIVWIVSLKLIRKSEYSNCHINWDKYRIEANETKNVTQWAAAFAVLATLAVAGDCFLSTDLFIRDWMRLVLTVTTVALALSYGILYDNAIRITRMRCIMRNQQRLNRLTERELKDGDIIFERKHNITIEPAWRHTVVMGNGWFLPDNLLHFEDYQQPAEIIPFPGN